MLNSYQEQGMLSKPMETPANANVHHILWHYTYKMCGTRKACMLCDSSAHQGTITLGHTFANSLDAMSERLFWAMVAKQGLAAYGAEVSNAFAKAPPPVHPLCMHIDDAYCNWWENDLKRPPLPPHYTRLFAFRTQCKATRNLPVYGRNLSTKYLNRLTFDSPNMSRARVMATSMVAALCSSAKSMILQ
jgi:hypothetical protein